MLVSIIVPIYNSEKYLAECIDSLINQSYKNIEIILVNDGSKDSSLNICHKYERMYDKVRVINKQNEGVSIARNYALNIIKGNYVAFCDSDDVMAPNQIEVLINNLVRSNSDMSMCSYQKFDIDKIQWELEKNFEFELYNDDMYEIIINNEKYSGYLWNKMFKKEIIYRWDIRFNDDIYILEDEIFIIDYLKYCKKIVVSNQKLYGYRHNSDGALNQNINEKKLTAILAREIILKKVSEVSSNSDIIYKAWNDLILEYTYSFKKVLLSNDKNLKKLYWDSYIQNKYKKYKKLFKPNKELKINERIYLFMLNLYSCNFMNKYRKNEKNRHFNKKY